MGYLTNFIVYTLAMVGVIMLAVLVFKTSTGSGVKAKSKYLKVHDTLSLGPRKTLYIVSAGDEKFLIAGDVDKTSLISKLEGRKQTEETLNHGQPYSLCNATDHKEESQATGHSRIRANPSPTLVNRPKMYTDKKSMLSHWG